MRIEWCTDSWRPARCPLCLPWYAVSQVQRACTSGLRLLCRCCFQEPEQVQQLSQSPEAKQLLAAWAPALAVLQIQPLLPAACQPAALAAAEAGGATADMPAADSLDTSQDYVAATHAEQPCACDSGSKSSSATNSPRSSMSSYASACVSTSTFSSTVVGSPAGCCPTNWMLSRSSSCCDCDSQHSAIGGTAAGGGRRAASEEQQREALTALVASARTHLNKQQLLVSHLARQTGLLYRLCEEVLAACESSSSSSPTGSCGRTAGLQQEAKARQERLQQVRKVLTRAATSQPRVYSTTPLCWLKKAALLVSQCWICNCCAVWRCAGSLVGAVGAGA
jgi:hypothetical protein